MMRRPVSNSDVDPRFKTVRPSWWGQKIITGRHVELSLPPCVGMWDPTIGSITYPNYVQLAKRKPNNRVYKPRGVPG